MASTLSRRLGYVYPVLFDWESSMTNGTYYAILGAIIMIIMILGVFLSNKL